MLKSKDFLSDAKFLATMLGKEKVERSEEISKEWFAKFQKNGEDPLTVALACLMLVSAIYTLFFEVGLKMMFKKDDEADYGKN